MYIINKIIDWNPINRITKVELLKIDITTAFDAPEIQLLNVNIAPDGSLPTNSIILGLSSYASDNYNLIIGNDNLLLKGYQYNMINGSDNQISERCVNNNISGSRNMIASDSSNINISNSNDCVVSSNCSNLKIDNSQYITFKKGVSNVSITNTSGITISQSNISYVNGNQISENSITPVINIIDGNDTMFSASICNIIKGGENINREYGSYSTINKIDGNIW